MQNKKQEQFYFDKFTAENPWNAFTDQTYDRIIELFVKLLKPDKKHRIIDMGCGTGELTAKIYRAGFKNTSGFDISSNCIALAKKRFKGIGFEIKDIENTDLNSNSIDILFYCGILHHLPDQNKAILEAKRILKKNGKVFIFEPNASNPVLWLFRNNNSPVKSTKLKTPNEEFLTIEQIENAFKKQNFRIERLEAISSIHYTKEHFQKLLTFPFYYSVYFYNIFDDIINLTPLKKRFGSFIYGYTKK